MKIMIVAAADSIHTIRWSNAFADRGHDVHLVSLPDHRVHGDKLDERVTLHYLKHAGGKGYILNAVQIRKLVKAIRPAVINVHYASGYGTLVSLAHVHPSVLSVWGSDVYEFPRKSELNRLLVNYNLRSADALASTSHAMAEQVRRVMRKPAQDITVTPFGVNLDLFTPTGKVHDKAEDTFLFGTIKTLAPIYGIDYIIRAFQLFLQKWNQLDNAKKPHLFICGRGDKTDYEKLSEELGIAEYVTIENYIPNEQVPEYLRSMDAVCLGSLEESFGVAAVEAMACGVPVIATDADGFKEVIVDNETGFIVPRKDIYAMAEKMWQLYENKNLRVSMGEKGRAHVCKHYNWSQNVDNLLNLLLCMGKKETK